jgi:hypothetical protein
MNDRQVSSSGYPITFFMTASGDPLTGLAGLQPTISIAKNGGSFVTPSGASGEIGSGWYKLVGHVDDRDTLGEFSIHAAATGASDSDGRYTIVGYDPFNATTLGLTNLDTTISSRSDGTGVTLAADQAVNVTKIGGSTTIDAVALATALDKMFIALVRPFTGNSAARTKAFKDNTGATDFTHTYSSDGNNSRSLS